MLLSYVRIGEGEWSIAQVDPDGDFMWWCGSAHGWVSPRSSYWEWYPDCWNSTYRTLSAARKFARSKGWEE
jgi:hypothetical protein